VAVAVNEPDASGTVQLAGDSHVSGTFYPAAWSVDATGTDVMVRNLGLEPAERAGYAEDINDFGDTIFQTILFHDPEIPDDPEGAAWVNVASALHELPTAGGVTVHVRAISNAGEIVGSIVFVDGSTRTGWGALWRLDADGVPGNPINLGSFIPRDISENGVMAGEDEITSQAAIATLDANDNPIVTPLGVVPGDSWSRANAISDNGLWVVGNSRSENDNEAFRWSVATGLVGLGRFGGVDGDALGVNNDGDAVGWSDTGGGKHSQTAVLWKDGQMLDLNTLVETRAHLQWARCINNVGHIGGHMDYPKPTREQHGFLLIPSSLLP
jgi:probable HAF family extracellular repeat protein